MFAASHEGDTEGSAMTVEVVAADRGAEHGRVEAKRVGRHAGDLELLTRDGVPDDEALALSGVEEHAAVAGVQHIQVGAVGGGGAEGGGGDELGHALVMLLQVEDKAEHGRCSMECAVAAEVRRVGEEVAPAPADEGGVHKARGVVRREAEEDLRGHVGDCPRRRRWCRHEARPFRHRRVHGSLLASFGAG
uniref:Uncharacterized protein n=1 Tax=Triticum urartu TaxID=4572 RepID=A0A8R7PF38_TRIUA